MRVRQATSEDVPALVALFQELDRMQADWRVFTPRPGFYDEVGAKYKEALSDPDQVVLVAEDDEGEAMDALHRRLLRAGARSQTRLATTSRTTFSCVASSAAWCAAGSGSPKRWRAK